MAAGDDSLVNRSLRAARLDAALYREVASDPAASSQALLLVLLVGLVGSLGGIAAGLEVALVSALLAPVAWLVTAGLARFVAVRVMGASPEGAWERAARTLGFAHAPAMLGPLVLIPYAGPAIFVVLGIWRMAAMYAATRAAFDLSPGQAATTLVLSFVTLGAVALVITAIAMAGAG